MSQPPEYEFVRATEGLKQAEIGNIFIPDLPGGADGETWLERNRLLAATAAEVFLRRPVGGDGLIVCGNPGWRPGRDGHSPDYRIKDSLIKAGVPEDDIDDTAKGIDPVTNSIRGQELFERNYAVGIVTTPGLWPIHRYIAERTMVRAFGGLLVKGVPDEKSMVHGFDALASRRVSKGQYAQRPNLAKAERRALRRINTATNVLHLSGARYYGDGHSEARQ